MKPAKSQTRNLNPIPYTLNPESGVTAVEMVVVATVMGMLMAVMTQFFTSGLLSQNRNESLTLVQTNTKQAVETTLLDIRSAQSVLNTNSVSDPNQAGGWTSDGDTLVLAVPALDSGDNPIYVDSLHTTVYTNNLVYHLSGGVIYRRMLKNTSAPGNTAVTTCPPASATPACPPDSQILEAAATLSFDYGGTPADAGTVKFTVSQTRTKGGRAYSSTLDSQATMRNK